MNIVSLFSGVGGLDLGFIQEGFNIVWANDFDRSACETYRRNIGNHIYHGDITEVSPDDIPDCDMIIGGSPCQGFSNANRTTHFLDNPKNLMVREFIRIVKAKLPIIFVLENVPQILTAGDGQFFDEICDELSDYKVTAKVMDSSEYGVPQARKRAIIIGCLYGSITHPLPTYTQPRTVKDAFKGLDDSLPNQKDYSKSTETNVRLMQYVPQGGNIFSIPENERPRGSHSSRFKRLKEDRPSITITNPRKSIIIHPNENRILSIRECARIQSFPDDFVFYGNLADKQQQVANAVPPLLGKVIAEEIRLYLDLFL